MKKAKKHPLQKVTIELDKAVYTQLNTIKAALRNEGRKPGKVSYKSIFETLILMEDALDTLREEMPRD